jgi:hypothetical protein
MSKNIVENNSNTGTHMVIDETRLGTKVVVIKGDHKVIGDRKVRIIPLTETVNRSKHFVVPESIKTIEFQGDQIKEIYRLNTHMLLSKERLGTRVGVIKGKQRVIGENRVTFEEIFETDPKKHFVIPRVIQTVEVEEGITKMLRLRNQDSEDTE